jgi:hypothetical protein
MPRLNAFDPSTTTRDRAVPRRGCHERRRPKTCLDSTRATRPRPPRFRRVSRRGSYERHLPKRAPFQRSRPVRNTAEIELFRRRGQARDAGQNMPRFNALDPSETTLFRPDSRRGSRGGRRPKHALFRLSRSVRNLSEIDVFRDEAPAVVPAQNMPRFNSRTSSQNISDFNLLQHQATARDAARDVLRLEAWEQCVIELFHPGERSPRATTAPHRQAPPYASHPRTLPPRRAPEFEHQPSSGPSPAPTTSGHRQRGAERYIQAARSCPALPKHRGETCPPPG